MAPIKVYVVDDDNAILESVAFLLGAAGHECRLFDRAEAFLTALPQLDPGCIITDLRMPAMGGFELVQAIHAFAPGWPVVLMTSENGSLTRASVAERGFVAFLRKPFSADDLLAAVNASAPKIAGGRAEEAH